MTLKEARQILTDDKQPGEVCPYCRKKLKEHAVNLVGLKFVDEVYRHHFSQHKMDAMRTVVAFIAPLSDDQLDGLESLRGRR